MLNTNISLHLIHTSLKGEELLRNCVSLNVECAHLLLKPLGLCFLRLPASLHVVAHTGLIVLHRFFCVLDLHREYSVEGVLF